MELHHLFVPCYANKFFAHPSMSIWTFLYEITRTFGLKLFVRTKRRTNISTKHTPSVYQLKRLTANFLFESLFWNNDIILNFSLTKEYYRSLLFFCMFVIVRSMARAAAGPLVQADSDLHLFLSRHWDAAHAGRGAAAERDAQGVARRSLAHRMRCEPGRPVL